MEPEPNDGPDTEHHWGPQGNPELHTLWFSLNIAGACGCDLQSGPSPPIPVQVPSPSLGLTQEHDSDTHDLPLGLTMNKAHVLRRAQGLSTSSLPVLNPQLAHNR